MGTKIGLISDVHATPASLQKALDVFAREQVEMILCAGDIAGYGPDLEQTVALLIENNCRAILGNHDIWHLEDHIDEQPGPVEDYLGALPVVAGFSIADTEISMVHGSPPDSFLEGIKLLDVNGVPVNEQVIFWSDALKQSSFDVLVVGHTHQVFAEQLGDVLVINPGSTRFNQTCAILNLPERTVEVVPLTDKEPILVWNWGMEVPDYLKKKP